MSALQTDAPDVDDQEAGEPDGMSERIARAVLLAVGALMMWGIVVALPETAYVVIGAILTHAVHRLRARFGRAGDAAEADVDEDRGPTALDVVHALHRVAGPHAFLADVADSLGLPTRDTRALLEELRIPVRRAVRNGKSTGVGVHRDDLPPLPHHPGAGPGRGVDLQQPTNQRGVTTTPLGLAGRLLHPAEADDFDAHSTQALDAVNGC